MAAGALLLFFCLSANAQYTNWITGDSSDLVTQDYQSGLVLAGGGGDNDNAMIWMLERAGGGDVLVLRASGSDGYNDYFYSQLGVAVHSVETIRFDGPAAATDPYVLRRIEEAEVLFLAGGDQYDYYQYWKDSPVETAINALLNEKQITVGGTSAGMAVLGEAYYTPSSLGVVSDEALSDPYHPYMDVIGKGDFLEAPYLQDLITDTHFDQRERAGRTMTFLARIAEDWGVRGRGIAANEYTAICVDESGTARAFGDYPEYEEDMVYFLQINCPEPFNPEICAPGQALHWLRNEQAVKVYRAPATPEGEHTFTLTDFLSGQGGFWEDWYVDQGQLWKLANATPPDCASVATHSPKPAGLPVRIAPNPCTDVLFVQIEQEGVFELTILHSSGVVAERHILRAGKTLSTAALPTGLYWLQVTDGQTRWVGHFVRI